MSDDDQKRRRSSCLLLVGLLLSAPAAAGENELAIALGLRAGGDLEISGSGRSPDLDATAVYGLIYNHGLGPETFLTTFWSHQSTELSAPGEFSDGDSFGIDIDYLHVGSVYRPERDGAAQGYVQFTAGLTWYRAERSGFGDELGFSLAAGGGGQFRISERLAFRVEGRIYATLTSASFAGLCVSGACTFAVSGSGALQFEGLGALVFGF